LRAPLYRRICCHIYFQSRGIDCALYLAEDERIRSSRANAITQKTVSRPTNKSPTPIFCGGSSGLPVALLGDY
jgi:hypothetical protein